MPTMPNVVGQLLQEAQALLEGAGVLAPGALGYFGTWPIVVSSARSSSPPGTVTAQSPAAEASVAANASVSLTISEYPMGFAYPAQNWSAF